MMPEDRTLLIDKYRDGYPEVMRALDGITEVELDTPEAPGEWSPRQVAHHLADSEMEAAVRIRRIVSLQNAVIQDYDQEAFAENLSYDRPVEASLAAFAAARAVTAELLVRLSDEDWARSGRHSEFGAFPAEEWLQYYADHAHDHAEQIRRARKAAQINQTS